MRKPPAGTNGASSKIVEEHDELNIIDQLDLAEESTHVRLKQLLLDTSAEVDDSIARLKEHINGRLTEGHGEALFDLGFEDSGESMNLTKGDWDFALARLQQAADSVRADCKILMTRNVGGGEDVGPTSSKDKAVSGKLMIRRRPEQIDDVIETRIAVVGNGRVSFHRAVVAV